MNDCIPAAELATLRDLPEDHPRRRHVEECARCRAGWLLYLDFVTTPSEADRSARRPRLAMVRWWPAPLAMAAVLASVALLTREPVAPMRPPASVLRGDVTSAVVRLEPARLAADGAIELRWRAFDGAAAYRVRLLSVAGEVLFESAMLPDTALVLRPGTMSEPTLGGGIVAWQVTAATASGTVRSEPGLIDLRRGIGD